MFRCYAVRPSLGVVLLVCGWLLQAGGFAAAAVAEEPRAAAEKPAAGTIVLFDGKSLEGWKVLDKIDYLAHGEVKVQDGQIVLSQGRSMTGIVWAGKKLPTADYEVTLEARRIEGRDFFCGLTFPVKDSHVSLVLGGWGGSMTGISSIDGFDASENETSGSMDFKNGQWYTIRVRVMADQVAAWVDKEQIVDLAITDRRLGVRWEMELCRPFGIATYETTGGIRNIVLKPLE